jgi:hypothetical protein
MWYNIYVRYMGMIGFDEIYEPIGCLEWMAVNHLKNSTNLIGANTQPNYAFA